MDLADAPLKALMREVGRRAVAQSPTYSTIRREVLGPLQDQLAGMRQDVRAIRRRLNDLRKAFRAQERRLAARDRADAGVLGDTTEEETASLKAQIDDAGSALAMAERSIQAQERQIRRLSSDDSALIEEWAVLHIVAMTGEDAEAAREGIRHGREAMRRELDRALRELGEMSGANLQQRYDAALKKLNADLGLPQPADNGAGGKRDWSGLLLLAMTVLILAWAAWQYR
jgi:chromosome segregation ATPase